MYKVYDREAPPLETMESISPVLAAAMHSGFQGQIHDACSDSSIVNLGTGDQVLREVAEALGKKIEWDEKILRQINLLRMAEMP